MVNKSASNDNKKALNKYKYLLAYKIERETHV